MAPRFVVPEFAPKVNDGTAIGVVGRTLVVRSMFAAFIESGERAHREEAQRSNDGQALCLPFWWEDSLPNELAEYSSGYPEIRSDVRRGWNWT